MICLGDEKDLSFNEGIVCLYFYTSWMPFHKRMLNLISKLEEKQDKIKFYAIDADHFKNLCKRFDVKSVPTIVNFVQGVQQKSIEGVVMSTAFNAFYNDICNKTHSENKNGKEK